MKDFWKKHKIIISVGVFILTGPSLFYWAILFMTEKIQKKADMIQEKIIDNSLEKLKIEEIPKMEAANEEFEKNKDSVGTIIDADSKIDFIKYIETLAEETNNKIKLKVLNDNQNENIDAKKNVKTAVKKNKNVEEKKNIEEELIYKQYISIQADLIGDYESFLNFVYKLENNKYYIDTISFDLRKELIEKEKLPIKENSGSSGIFFSSARQDGSETEENGQSALKSSLEIIVYVE